MASTDGAIKNAITGAVDKAVDKLTSRPNILLITCDQYRFPRFAYGPNGGFHPHLKEILGFQPLSADNQFVQFFPGLMKLRKYATVLRNHMIAASACTPSRAVIYTGQYGTRTGVTQTDGLFKNGDAHNFPWLDADGIPTLGTWMREAGYTTHYFGKWHVSNPPGHSLKRYGFDNWEESYPEPHGSQANNLGVFRDVGFTDSACAFLRRQGLAVNYDRVYANMLANDPNSSGPKITHVPWFAVASFTNPHDIATYPGVISQALPGTTEITLPNRTITLPTQSPWGPLTIPDDTAKTPAPAGGTMQIPLNPLNFPRNCANASPTQIEDLSSKPSCQYEYSYKMGLALASKLGFNVAAAMSGASEEQQTVAGVAATLKSCIPFQLADNGTPDENCLEFLQLYAWLHAVVDPHIDAVLTAL
ncbi:MAG TPA: sulfatase-like hydrolase/transferase, partial [Tepidisphaeraceae bacterium]|nr:sulfatase-like hydrolase/transferase [Tepidisphaeraceae bacterium]